MRLLIILFALFVVSVPFSTATAQVKKQKFKVYVHQGDSAKSNGNNYGAYRAYKNALGIKQDIDVAYKCAEACRGYQNYIEAEKWYKVVKEKDSSSYKLASFWLGEMMKYNEKYDEASKAFQYYYDAYKDDNDYYAKKAKHEIDVCREYVKEIKHDDKVKIKHLPSKINTMYTELSPTIYMDSVMFFTGIRPIKRDSNSYFTKIYQTHLVDSVWQKPKELPSAINDPKSVVTNLTFAYDSVTVFFNKCNYEAEASKYLCKIYEGKYKNGFFKDVRPLPNTINYPRSTASNPALAMMKDGTEYMFFCSDRPGGQGKRDIWYAQRFKNGRFGKPLNAGSNINTPGEEVTPFFDVADSTLYFSSEMHVGLGGYDVFKAKADMENKRFSKTVNMGTPVNSSYNDLYYRYSSDSLYAYMISNRIGSTRFVENAFGNDIYRYKLTKKVKDLLKGIVPFSIYFDNDQPDPRSTDTVTDKVYSELVVPYLAQREHYIKQFKRGTTKEQEKYYTTLVADRFDLDIKSGWEDLQKFVSLVDFLLHDGEDIVVTFKGYASNLHTAEYNRRLAQRRIVSVKNYFLNYEDGLLMKFLDKEKGTGKGSLELIEVALGVVEEDNTFKVNGESVNLKTIGKIGKREKVYGPSAILQRKIEILAVKTTESEEELERQRLEIEEEKKRMVFDKEEGEDDDEGAETTEEDGEALDGKDGESMDEEDKPKFDDDDGETIDD